MSTRPDAQYLQLSLRCSSLCFPCFFLSCPCQLLILLVSDQFLRQVVQAPIHAMFDILSAEHGRCMTASFPHDMKFYENWVSPPAESMELREHIFEVPSPLPSPSTHPHHRHHHHPTTPPCFLEGSFFWWFCFPPPVCVGLFSEGESSTTREGNAAPHQTRTGQQRRPEGASGASGSTQKVDGRPPVTSTTKKEG